MKKLFVITEEEKKRILGLHENATKRHYLNEQLDTSNCDNYYIPTNGKVIKATNEMKACDTKRDFKKTPCVTQRLSQRGVNGSGEPYYFFGGKRIYGKTKTFPNKGGVTSNSDTGMVEMFFTCADIEKILKGGDSQTNPAETQLKQRTVPTSIDQLSQKGYYLRKGDKGELVRTIQRRLLDAGEDVALTSVFDDMTKNAVMSFQTKNNLKADGVVGPKTWALLSKSQMKNMTTKDTEPLKSIAPSNVPDNYGQTNQGVANPNQTPIRGTGRGSGLGQIELNQP